MPLPAVHVLSDRPVFLASGHWMSKNMQHLASLFFYCVSVWLHPFCLSNFCLAISPLEDL